MPAASCHPCPMLQVHSVACCAVLPWVTSLQACGLGLRAVVEPKGHAVGMAWRGCFARALPAEWCFARCSSYACMFRCEGVCRRDRPRYGAAFFQPQRLERPLGRQGSEARAFKAPQRLQTPICRLRMAAEKAVFFELFSGAAEAQLLGRQRVSGAGDKESSITVFGWKRFASNIGCS